MRIIAKNVETESHKLSRMEQCNTSVQSLYTYVLYNTYVYREEYYYIINKIKVAPNKNKPFSEVIAICIYNMYIH